MSKIPQGEWSAIAARYAKGESITRIAQSYGCTPPAIHYILKRSKQRAAQNLDHRISEKSDSTMTFAEGPPEPIMMPVRSLEISVSSTPESRIACSMAT